VGADRLTAAFAVAALLVAAGCDDGADQSQAERPTARTGVVARVNDGDTLTLSDGAKIRLVQIDAPELTTDCYGRAAQRALTSLAPAGARVRLVRDPALDDRDRYGRLLRYVFVGETDVNVELVRRGAAAPYFFRNERGEHALELMDAVQNSQNGHRGYWGACPRARLNTGLGALTGPA
jgi:endonuclease YncB( thermonuclease family)